MIVLYLAHTAIRHRTTAFEDLKAFTLSDFKQYKLFLSPKINTDSE